MLHGSETWPVRKENVVALQRAEMRMVRWSCGVKLKDRLLSKELTERLGIDDGRADTRARVRVRVCVCVHSTFLFTRVVHNHWCQAENVSF